MLRREKEDYLKAARSTEVFNSQEIEILSEVLQDCRDNQEKNYFLFEEKQDNSISGFVIFGKTSLTEFCWDVYWLVVDKSCQGKGVGRKLLGRVESFLLKGNSGAVLRVETSARKEYVHARGLYTKQGFKGAGRIPNFYSKQDDLVIFYKEIKVV
ncbi:MAG: GNAT family N-acetyltransferase [Candidatus Omnitrophica bacterium]|nr:GNAT family N-acetyltransferase [Candidatus Omnitrophota bacterium]MBU1524593.1 GNAT family N-acetyltransferase [Candidatus Omnitrophota bacterium]